MRIVDIFFDVRQNTLKIQSSYRWFSWDAVMPMLCYCYGLLHLWGRNKMGGILQTTFSNSFFLEIYVWWFLWKIHIYSRKCVRVQLTSHYQSPWWLNLNRRLARFLPPLNKIPILLMAGCLQTTSHYLSQSFVKLVQKPMSLLVVTRNKYSHKQTRPQVDTKAIGLITVTS